MFPQNARDSHIYIVRMYIIRTTGCDQVYEVAQVYVYIYIYMNPLRVISRIKVKSEDRLIYLKLRI